MADKPCPNCGHCPSCGRSNFKPFNPYPWYGTWPPNYITVGGNTNVSPYKWTNTGGANVA